jgi:hypothetical protein
VVTETASEPADLQERAAAAVFALVEVVAFVYWMVLARREWFFDDEWDFIAARRIGSLHDLFASHYGHWSTAPIVVYRLLWTLFGLRSYLPYLATVVLAHLACAALLRVIMRRASVTPWIATVAAAVFAFFGTGYQDIVWAFQIGFDFALGFGLVALLLADRDGSLGRRDALGIGAGVVALASSGVGVAMAVVVVLATLVRRGWKVAAAYAGVLGPVYLVWWSAVGRHDAQTATPSLADVGRFVRDGFAGAFQAIEQLPGLGWLLALLTVAGLAVMFSQVDLATVRRRAAPLAMVVGAVAFLALSGSQRVTNLGAGYARASRYQHIVVALILPTVAVAIDAIASRWQFAAPFLALLLLVGVPGNIGTLHDYTRRQAALFRVTRQTVLALPKAPLASRVPPDVRPLPENADTARVTIGWLRSAARQGKVPDGGTVAPRVAEEIAFRLSILQYNAPDPAPTDCHVVMTSESRILRQGETLVFRNGAVRLSTTRTPRSHPVSLAYSTYSGDHLTVVGVAQLTVIIGPATFFAPTVCG